MLRNFAFMLQAPRNSHTRATTTSTAEPSLSSQTNVSIGWKHVTSAASTAWTPFLLKHKKKITSSSSWSRKMMFHTSGLQDACAISTVKLWFLDAFYFYTEIIIFYRLRRPQRFAPKEHQRLVLVSKPREDSTHQPQPNRIQLQPLVTNWTQEGSTARQRWIWHQPDIRILPVSPQQRLQWRNCMGEFLGSWEKCFGWFGNRESWRLQKSLEILHWESF